MDWLPYQRMFFTSDGKYTRCNCCYRLLQEGLDPNAGWMHVRTDCWESKYSRYPVFTCQRCVDELERRRCFYAIPVKNSLEQCIKNDLEEKHGNRLVHGTDQPHHYYNTWKTRQLVERSCHS